MVISPFKSFNIAYWICLALDIGIALAFWLAYDSNPVFTLLFAGIWFVVLRMLFTSRSVKKINRFVAEHTASCHLRPCISLYEDLLKITKGSKDFIYINLSTLYLACGEFEKMNQALSAIPETFKADPKSISMACFYYNNRAFGYLMSGNLDQAEQDLEKMKYYLDLPTAVNANHSRALYEAKQYLLRVLRGEAGEIEFDLREKLVEQRDPSGQLLYGYILCTYLLNQGQRDKAKEYLTPMAENGGDTFYAAWAREKLDQICIGS